MSWAECHEYECSRKTVTEEVSAVMAAFCNVHTQKNNPYAKKKKKGKQKQ